ncbi:1334_t:CDS:2 [Funneliformis caledonium]|uniref:1334_t:CDS:1 n=1 Tax=Funneliformis caledonium TaxID=1117310 RepID=A0A9N9F2I2_9GLOM|nr:1334_t:CDS:2 [Funneliformis caledonium]
MWCDNCLLIFPLRAGAIALSLLMALYQIGGGIFLFLYGDFYFTIYPEASLYGGYAMAQGAVRAGVMTWELNHFKDRIEWECNNGGVKWADAHNNDPDFKPPPALKDNPRLPNGFCRVGVESVGTTFAFAFVIDFILMGEYVYPQ